MMPYVTTEDTIGLGNGLLPVWHQEEMILFSIKWKGPNEGDLLYLGSVILS